MTRAGQLVAISNLVLIDTIMSEPIRKTVHYPGRVQSTGLRQSVTPVADVHSVSRNVSNFNNGRGKLIAKAFSQSLNHFFEGVSAGKNGHIVPAPTMKRDRIFRPDHHALQNGRLASLAKSTVENSCVNESGRDQQTVKRPVRFNLRGA